MKNKGGDNVNHPTHYTQTLSSALMRSNRQRVMGLKNTCKETSSNTSGDTEKKTESKTYKKHSGT